MANPRDLRRFLPRPSVRALMGIVLVVGGFSGWVAHEVRSARGRRDAVSAIRAEKYNVFYDWQWKDEKFTTSRTPPWPAWLIDAVGIDLLSQPAYIDLSSTYENNFGRTPPGKADRAMLASIGRFGRLEFLNLRNCPLLVDADLVHLRGLTGLRELQLGSRGSIRGPGLVHLAALPKLETLLLIRIPDLADAHLAPLAGCRSLRRLNISHLGIDGSMKSLCRLSSVQELTLGGANIDSHMPAIGQMKDLRLLRLRFSGVTDAGLKSLADLTHLNTLDLQSTQVTKEGEAELQRALPQVQISRGGP